jgi:hypothetical protein
MHRAEPSAGLIRITGTGDQLPPESVITFHRIARSASTGIRDHVRPERAVIDGTAAYNADHYRLSPFYDLAKIAATRMAWAHA